MEIIKIHEELEVDSLFKGFSREIIFIYKAIKNLPPFEENDYDMMKKIKNYYKKISKIKAN